MLIKRCSIYYMEQITHVENIDFPKQASSSSGLAWFLGLTRTGSHEVWGRPKGGNSRKRNRHFDNSHHRPTRSPYLYLRPKMLTFFSLDLYPIHLQHSSVYSLLSPQVTHWWRAWFLVHWSAFAVAYWLAEGEMLWCLFAVGGFLQGQRIPSAAFCFSPLPCHGVGYMILSSDLPLAEPEQIERILCAASSSAFKCFFFQNILQILN